VACHNEKRDQVVIATKVGKMTTRPGLRRDNIIAAVDDSLRRLGTDHIDLYYAHFDDRDTARRNPAGFSRTGAGGKVLALGASNYSATRLHEAHAIAQTHLTPYVAVQNQYNLVTRDHYEIRHCRQPSKTSA
jgi:aryl-alcohol dehydrogenase-like predicted oxidoreductase